jgi:hypothetical protein
MVEEHDGIYNWNRHEGPKTPQREPRHRVEIDDETWRDGMQGTQEEEDKTQPTTEERDVYIHEVTSRGYVDHFDIGFPGSGILHRDQIVNLINSSQRRNDGVTFSVAGRAGAVDDARAILEIADRTGVALEADLFWDPSKIRSKVNGWDRDEMIRRTASNIRFLKDLFSLVAYFLYEILV